METEARGRPIICKNCEHQFKIIHKLTRENWDKNKSICPECKEPYCNKPLTERQLMVLQDKYFESGRKEKYLAEIAHILFDYAKSLMLKFYSNSTNTPEGLEYYPRNAVSFIIEEFLKKENYKVYYSFGGLLLLKIKQALLNKYEKFEGDYSLDWHFEDDHSVHYQDTNRDILEFIEQEENKFHLLEYLCKFIFGVEKYCSQSSNYIRLLAVWKNISLGEEAADRLFLEEEKKKSGIVKRPKTYGRGSKEIYENTLKALKKELLRLKQNNN